MADRAFVRFDVVLPATIMGNFDRQLRLEGVPPEPETRQRAIEGTVVLLHGKPTSKKPHGTNEYLAAHRG
jgi:hypothetical protein